MEMPQSGERSVLSLFVRRDIRLIPMKRET